MPLSGGTVSGNLSVTGTTTLGNGSGDKTKINDILELYATDSGDAHFYFGEDSSGGYGSYWNWDSLYTHTWYSRHASTNTALMSHDTRYTHKFRVNRGIERVGHSNGYFIGSYNSTGANSAKTNPIYTIGDSYRPTDTSFGNMYGIGYAHNNLWGGGKSNGWGLYINEAGRVFCTISSNGMWHEDIGGVWGSSNDGSGSGLDADLLDGQQPSQLSVNYANSAGHLPTYYVGGQQTNPQVYFGQSIGLRVAMTGYPNVWSDTLWINGYAGGDVKNMCALHTIRNGQPRMWISSQLCDASSYGTAYEFWTSYNDGSGSGLDADTVDGIQGSSFLRSDANDSFGGTLTHSNHIALVPDDYGKGIFGKYSSTRYQHVWSMGTAYKTSSNGTSYGNMYGLTWTHTNVGTGTNQSISGLSHQLQLRMNGTLYCAFGSGIWTSGNITAYSDRAVKTNLEVIPNALDKVMAINGYTYDRTDFEPDPETGTMPETRQAGVVAQEVEAILPEVVSGEEGNKAVAYGNMVALLIEAIKEQQTQISELQAQIKSLKEK